MAGPLEIKRSDYDELLKKLLAFAETLSPSEQLAFDRILRSGGVPPGASSGSFPNEAWHTFMGIVSNNSGTISGR